MSKIDPEDFSMLEEFRRSGNKSQQGENDVQKPYPKSRNSAAPKKNTVIDSNQAAKKYGGVMIIDGRGKYQSRNSAAPTKRIMEP
ncbi:hypothetical protein CDL12_21353 [Handroanthus impetiginosus]|uniref:Uncharacterized protein n=1 Tax=Handroanthus impetiginosus TaxID=429701 RepID=A0A2G9GLC5_9LAMI|nr:hypothetical protein CDL12_21353 [Handroanthus impetiginosus]